MRNYAIRLKEEPLLESRQESWIRGLNTLVSATQIKDNEVSEMTDCELIEDGKIKCPRDGQSYYGSTSGNRVTGLFSYYKSDGTRELLRISETYLQKLNTSTDNWDNISGKTYYATSASPSVSPSVSISPSVSLSPSASPTNSPSVSVSPSLSPSVSPSVSISPSASPTNSPSVSISPSVSLSPSVSPSVSVSPSPSLSTSPSLSPSVSPSPSLADSLETNGVTAYDRLYLCNGRDTLSYYDGSSITSFTGIDAPLNPTVTRTGGSTGTFTFSYKITAVTAVGETLASGAGTATVNQAELSDTVYMTVTWTAVTDAIGYNIYGRKDGQWFMMKYVEGNGSGTVGYKDDNTDTPFEATIPPEENTTGGPIGSIIEVYKDSLFMAGIDGNPSRLYYSRGGDQINNFAADESGGGGGFLDVSKNDGQIITGLKVFKDNLLVFKEDSIYQFSFTSAGLPQISQVNPSVGCIAPRSIVAVENDVFFLSRRGLFTIGNEAGFSFDVLRTNELSARVRSVMQNIDPAYIQNSSAVYTTDSDKNLYILSYTPSGSNTNTSAVVYDRERLGFYKWTNIKANCWTKFIGTDGIVHYLYGDDSSGYVKEILSGTTDFGSAIHGYFYLKGNSFEPKSNITRYKTLKDIDTVLRTPSGSIVLSVVKDGVETSYTAPISSVQPAVNFGHYVFNRFLFKSSYGTGVSGADQLLLRTLKNVNIQNGKTFQLRFDNNSSSSFVLLATGMTAKPKSDSFRISTDIVSV